MSSGWIDYPFGRTEQTCPISAESWRRRCGVSRIEIELTSLVCRYSDQVVDQGLPVQSVELYPMQQRTMIRIMARPSQKVR